MPRKKTTGRAVTAAKPDTNLAKLPQRLAIGDTEIRPTQLFVHTARHPKVHGPWSDEPDKLSWIDPKTGKDCILLRQYGGHWAGFVAVGIGHPLWGFNADAIPSSAGLFVHGPIDYAAPCDERGEPETSVCHIRPERSRTPSRSIPERSKASHAIDRTTNWWFGFSADQRGDYVPNHNRPLEREEGQVYRDIDYMFREVTELATKLDALESRHTGSLGPPTLDLPALKPIGKGGDNE